MKYLVTLRLYIGEYEKYTTQIIEAENEKEAGTAALIGECHGEPDFDEFPDKDGVWDMYEMVYKVYKVKELTDHQYEILNELI